jgi:hypothetical protein
MISLQLQRPDAVDRRNIRRGGRLIASSDPMSLLGHSRPGRAFDKFASIRVRLRANEVHARFKSAARPGSPP